MDIREADVADRGAGAADSDGGCACAPDEARAAGVSRRVKLGVFVGVFVLAIGTAAFAMRRGGTNLPGAAAPAAAAAQPGAPAGAAPAKAASTSCSCASEEEAQPAQAAAQGH